MRKIFTSIIAAAMVLFGISSASAQLVPESTYPTEEEGFIIPDHGTVFEQINLYFNEVVTVNPDKKIVLTAQGGTNYACQATFNTAMVAFGTKMVMVTFDGITQPGEYTLTIPEGAFTGNTSNTVNPALSYTFKVTGQAASGSINDVEIVSITPAEGTKMAGFNEGDKIVLKVTKPEAIAHISWSLYNLTDKFVDDGYINTFSDEAVTRVGDDQLVFENKAMDFPFYAGNIYEFRFTFIDSQNAMKEFSVKYEGTTTTDYKVSDVKILSIDPKPDMDTFLTADNCTVTLKFSDAVVFDAAKSYVTGGGQMAATGDVKAVSADGGKTWKITADTDFVKYNFGGFFYILGFTDADGAVVLPTVEQQNANDCIAMYINEGTGRMECISLRYNCVEGGYTVDADPAAGEYESLSVINFTNPDTYSLNAINWGNIAYFPVVLLDESGKEVARGAEYLSTLADESDPESVSTKITVKLDKIVTAAGKYTLVVPQQAITLGTEFSSAGYKGQTIEYTIKNSTSLGSLTISATASDVYNMQGILIRRGATADDLRNLPAGLYIISGKKVIIK